MLFIPDSEWLVGPMCKYRLEVNVFLPYPILFSLPLVSPKDSSKELSLEFLQKYSWPFTWLCSLSLLVVMDV